MKQHLNKKIKSEFAFSLLALFLISGLLLIQNSDKKNQNIAYATETTTATVTKCTDSDNGSDYFKKGTVIFDLFGSGNTDFQKTDECSTTVTGQLNEYKCVDDVWKGVTYQCPNGCKDGACIKIANDTCIDSDKGSDYFTKGRVYNPTTKNGTFDSYDKCSETNAGQLLEYTCKNNAWYAVNYQCPNGCKDGACINTQKCTDSDNGLDYFKKGTVIFDLFGSGNTDFKKTDECSTTVTGQLNEYKCVDDVWKGVTYQCPNGCKDGACINNNDVSIKDFSVASVNGAWKASGHIQRSSSSNNVVIWASFDGGTAKQIGNEIATDGSFYFTPSKYWTLSAGKHTIKVDARPTLTDPTLPNTAEASFTVEAKESSYSLPNNTIIKLPGENKFYALVDGKKIAITSISDLTKYGYKASDIEKIAKEYGIQTLKEDPNSRPKIIGDAATGKIYRIINGKKVWVPTISAFNAQGLKWEEVENQITEDNSTYSETRLVKDSKGNIYFITNNGKKKLIINTAVFNSYENKAEDIVEVSDDFLSSIETVKLVKEKDGNKIYLITGNTKQWIKNAKAFMRLKLKWEDVDIVNSTEINAYTEGAAIE